MKSKIDVTLSISPRFRISTTNSASPVLTTNLNRNNKLNVFYDYITPIENIYYDNYIKLETDNVNINKSLLFYNIKEIDIDFYNLYISDYIKTKYVILSLCNLSGLNYLIALLKHGNKVILGGAPLQLIFNKTSKLRIRKFLLDETDLSEDVVNNNLIIVEGFCTTETDFYQIIKDWKDVKLPVEYSNYDFLYNIDDDYLAKFFGENSYFILPLSIGCLWGNCKFCYIKGNNLKYIKFWSRTSKDVVKNYLEKAKKLYKCKRLFLQEEYLSNETINFIKENLDISYFKQVLIFTGVKKLKDKRYVDNLFTLHNNLKLSIGFDIFNDDSLKIINKGYTLKDIRVALDNLIEAQKKYDSVKFITYNIVDDVLCTSNKSLDLNEKNLTYVDKELRKHFIAVEQRRYPLAIFEEGLLNREDTPYHKIIDNPRDENVCGTFAAATNITNDKSTWWHKPVFFISKPFVRYDENGNILKSRINK